MTGINVNSPSLLNRGIESLKKSIREGTLQMARSEVQGASPELKAKLEQKYQKDVQELEKGKANYRMAVALTGADADNNVSSLPDVATLDKAEAKSLLSGLRQMKFVGDLDGKTLTANNGSKSTDNFETYIQWLQVRAGIDVYA